MNFLPFFELRKTCSLELQENSKEETIENITGCVSDV